MLFVLIVLKEYLARLETDESKKPTGKQRTVPNLGELADAIGTTCVNLSKIVNNKTESLNLKLGSKIIEEMNCRGFP
jgi:hypothetical protein